MHRNTYLLLIFLAILAAVVTGVNLTRGPDVPVITTAPKLPTPTPEPSKPTEYVLPVCGISFPVPVDHTALEGPGNNVVFTSNTGGDSVLVTCQKNIPKPALPKDKTEELTFDIPGDTPATISATLYHDTEAKNGTAIEKLIFTHPVNKLDIFISGTGESFQNLIRALSIIR